MTDDKRCRYCEARPAIKVPKRASTFPQAPPAGVLCMRCYQVIRKGWHQRYKWTAEPWKWRAFRKGIPQ
jgi:hypothetical protein